MARLLRAFPAAARRVPQLWSLAPAAARLSLPQSCVRSLHATVRLQDGKASFVAQLEHEIADEAENGEQPESSDTLGDFAVTHTVGNPIVTMTAAKGADTVNIKVDINECTHADPLDDGNGEEESTGKEPRFTIEIVNGATGQTMVAKCEAFAEPTEDGNDTVYPFIIHEVGIVAKGSSETDTYFSDPGFWDDVLEETMREFLAEKGVDEEFVEDLCHYVHNKEYSDYLQLLETMSGFARSSD